MVIQHKWKGLALCGIAALVVAGLALKRPAGAQTTTDRIPKDTILAASTNTGGHDEIWKITPGKDPEVFAHVNPGDGTDNPEFPWLCPIGVSPVNGHLYVATTDSGGTLWDIPATGGDRTSDKPLATKIFADQPSKMDGMAFDAAGNIYLDSSEMGDQPIAKVAPDGKVSMLKGTYNEPKGLAIKKDANNKEILYVALGGAGEIHAYNLTDDKAIDEPFAKGFLAIDDHTPGSLAVDPRGHLMVLWRLDDSDKNTPALFDITSGGDFSDVSKTPPVSKGTFRSDTNEIAFDSQNNLYAAGNDSHSLWMSKFDSAKGTFADFAAIAGTAANLGDLNDSEAMTVAP